MPSGHLLAISFRSVPAACKQLRFDRTAGSAHSHANCAPSASSMFASCLGYANMSQAQGLLGSMLVFGLHLSLRCHLSPSLGSHSCRVKAILRFHADQCQNILLVLVYTGCWYHARAVHAVICVACHQRLFLDLRHELAVVQEVWRQAGEAQNLSQLAEVIPNT